MTLLPDLAIQQQLSQQLAAQLHQQAPITAQIAQRFGKARESYVGAARLQQQVALNALTLLPSTSQGHLVDLGCGPGWLHPKFTEYCQQLTAIDLSQDMLAKAAELALAKEYLQADAAHLPLADNSVDKVFSSLMLQWCPKPSQVLSEMQRVLANNGQFVISTLVQGSLDELRHAFATLDNENHVNEFLPAEQLMKLCQQIPSIKWQFVQRSYPLYYPDVISLARELKALGANQVVGKKRLGLTGKQYWQQLAQAYEQHRTAIGLKASYQVLFIYGKKLGPTNEPEHEL